MKHNGESVQSIPNEIKNNEKYNEHLCENEINVIHEDGKDNNNSNTKRKWFNYALTNRIKCLFLCCSGIVALFLFPIGVGAPKALPTLGVICYIAATGVFLFTQFAPLKREWSFTFAILLVVTLALNACALAVLFCWRADNYFFTEVELCMSFTVLGDYLYHQLFPYAVQVVYLQSKFQAQEYVVYETFQMKKQDQQQQRLASITLRKQKCEWESKREEMYECKAKMMQKQNEKQKQKQRGVEWKKEHESSNVFSALG
jgi:cation transport ATPase